MEKMINYKKENSVTERNRLVEENYRLAFYWIKQAITRGISKERNIIHVPSDKSSEKKEEYSTVSLDINIGEDGDSSLNDIIADNRVEDPFETVAKQCQKESVKAVLEFLDPKEAKVLSLHYGIDSNAPMTLEQIAKLPEFDVTRERIRQIENKAISKIRRSPRMRRMVKDSF